MSAHKATVEAVLQVNGQSYAGEVGADISRNTPSPLYRWLVASALLSARISQDIATDAAKALSKKGWRTPQKMADATWRQRTDTLNHAGYARYDESTSRMLGDGAALLLEKYDGDLRKLREEAERDPKQERKLIKEFKGIGDTGADIFFREAQIVWDEIYPFADKKSLAAARKLGLPGTAKGLSKLVSKKEFPRLLSALVRTDLAKQYDEVKACAR